MASWQDSHASTARTQCAEIKLHLEIETRRDSTELASDVGTTTTLTVSTTTTTPTLAPLQGAPLLGTHQSKEDERVIYQRIENENLLWIDEPEARGPHFVNHCFAADEPEYHYDVE